jgi:long-chain acyl-CoA synthetase
MKVSADDLIKRVDQTHISTLLEQLSATYGKRTAVYFRDNTRWAAFTYSELSSKAASLSNYLIEWGVKEGDRIAILSESGPEWVVAFFAALQSGAIVVPLDIKLTAAELTSILASAEPRLLFVSSSHVATAQILRTEAPGLEEVVQINKDSSIAGINTSNSHSARTRNIDDVALIVYTSGTTGRPKGVMITFRTLMFQCESFKTIMRVDENDLFISMLPLNHLLELSIGLLGVLYAGGVICYCHTLYPQDIVEIMQQRQVTRLITVPLFLKMLKGSIEKEISRRGLVRRRVFHTVFAIAHWIPGRILKSLCFYPVHKQFGGKLWQFISGGAPLESEVADFFERIGFSVCQGYGLTETGPVISVNTPDHSRYDSVGRPLPGVRVKILTNGASEQHGEILTRGPHVMKGYYKSDDLTLEVIDHEGWLHTGDVGRIDKDGFLYITGRLKNLIVLGNGKKVHPEEVEAAIAKSPMIKEACVIGRLSQSGIRKGSEEVCAVVVPSDSLARNASMKPAVLKDAIKNEIDRLSRGLAPFKRPSTIVVRLEELPKTPTRKVRRSLLSQWLEERTDSHNLITVSHAQPATQCSPSVGVS